MSEILAPAGSLESVYAAVRCGADAVYLASEAFNARRGAKNFTFEELKEAVDYCHIHGVKVYHALNTLVKDSEIDALKEELKRILTLGEDALILQDLGVARLVKSLCPTMPLHASTQLTAHSLAAVQELEHLGFKRVVLAREMRREEILHIKKHCRAELEIFVHGALCMCVSGQCLLSAFLGARSGNRGLCAQPCRLPFSVPNGTGYDLSLKDNSLLDYLPELESAGIESFKIEGRMKRPEYVAACVSACRSALRGDYDSAQQRKLQNIFSRQGFTDGYFTGYTGRAMFGYRTKDDVTAAGTDLFKAYAALYAKEIPTVPCRMEMFVAAGAAPRLRMTARGETVSVEADVLPEAALCRELTQEELKERLSKLGGTPFFAQSISVSLEKGLMVSAGTVNALRRAAVEEMKLRLKTVNSREILYFPAPPQERIPAKKRTYLRFADTKQTKGLHATFDKIILPIEQMEEALASFNSAQLILETPRVFFGQEERLIALLDAAKQRGVTAVSVGNIGALRLAKERGFHILAGLGMNVFNAYAAEETDAHEMLLSVEMATGQINHFRCQKPYGSIVYGHIPLMITRNCPLQNGTNCAHCDKHGAVSDRKGEQFPVRCRFGASELFNPHALYMLDKEDSIHCDFSMLYFTVESPAQIRHILDLREKRAKADFPFTRGLYQKGVH